MTDPLPHILETVFTGQWVICLKFAQDPRKKTGTYGVFTKDTGQLLAEIRWYGRWRKFSLYPKVESIWEATCLREMAFVLEQLTQQQRRAQPQKGLTP